MNQSEMNKLAWNYRAYEFWEKLNGKPSDAAKSIQENPRKWLNRFEDYFHNVNGMKILVPLGSNGRKALPLAVLGADVTVIDISEANCTYAKDVANFLGINLNYIVSDFLTYENESFNSKFDYVLAEGGILHYFSNLDSFFSRICKYLKYNGELVLNDFHPNRKYVKFDNNNKAYFEGDYFENELHEGPVAYEDQFPETEREKFPKCMLRFWTLAEIITSIGKNGLFVSSLKEGKNWKNNQMPGDFTIDALKLKVTL